MLAFFVLLVGSFKTPVSQRDFTRDIAGGSAPMIDKLSLISAPKVSLCCATGALHHIAVHEIVLDDVIRLSDSQQICAGAVVRRGEVGRSTNR